MEGEGSIGDANTRDDLDDVLVSIVGVRLEPLGQQLREDQTDHEVGAEEHETCSTSAASRGEEMSER